MPTLHIDLERVIRAPRPVVWSYLTTVIELSRWVERLESASSDAGSTLVNGATLDFVFQSGHSVFGAVTACRTNDLLALESRLVRGHLALDRIRLEDAPVGTKVMLAAEHTTETGVFKPGFALGSLFVVPFRPPFSILREMPPTPLHLAYDRSLDSLATLVEAAVAVPYR